MDRSFPKWIIAIFVVLALLGGYYAYQRLHRVSRFMRLRQYRADPEGHADWGLQAGARCGDAPFLIPTDGFAAFLWGDRYPSGRRHQGLDIFGADGLGETPVLAAYDGTLSRLPDWRASVILRVPEDPLNPDRQIWLYYTHMADSEGNSFIVPDFPAGTINRPITAGTLIGYQGNYSADVNAPTGIHLHFSIVLDDGEGGFRNELIFENTLDPSPYLGFALNGEEIGSAVASCPSP